jgi:DNA polymerase-3 subunit epsilon
VADDAAPLPCPRLSIDGTLPAATDSAVGDLELPSAAGVYLLEDETGRAVVLATTANLRRAVRAKLAAPATDPASSRRADLASVTRRVRAVTVGSSFEADWAWLQLARQHLPQSYRSLLGRWLAWFVHIDPEAAFPQFVKAPIPGTEPVRGGVWLGPVPDKHAAARYIETLQSVFDLCRYHHILVQAPRGDACAYKEMGRCPAPCDGSVTMGAYHDQVRAAIDFATTPHARWRAATETAMAEASSRLDFESARHHRRRLDDARAAARSEFAYVSRIDSFRFVAIARSELPDHARLFTIVGGHIEPLADIPLTGGALPTAAVTEAASKAMGRPFSFSDAEAENLGLVCRHLFRPKSESRDVLFLPAAEPVTERAVSSALLSLRRRTRGETPGPFVAEAALQEP